MRRLFFSSSAKSQEARPVLSSPKSQEARPVLSSSKSQEARPVEDKWIVEERSIDEARPLRVVIIGSGISGIIASIRFRQRIPNVDLCVYEKNEDIGGTWFENRYPGCACGEACHLC
jgi:heterodisulfide reductase subunit A-like polyferredoxin